MKKLVKVTRRLIMSSYLSRLVWKYYDDTGRDRAGWWSEVGRLQTLAISASGKPASLKQKRFSQFVLTLSQFTSYRAGWRDIDITIYKALQSILWHSEKACLIRYDRNCKEKKFWILQEKFCHNLSLPLHSIHIFVTWEIDERWPEFEVMRNYSPLYSMIDIERWRIDLNNKC